MKLSVPGKKSKHKGDKALADFESLTNVASHKKTKMCICQSNLRSNTT